MVAQFNFIRCKKLQLHVKECLEIGIPIDLLRNRQLRDYTLLNRRFNFHWVFMTWTLFINMARTLTCSWERWKLTVGLLRHLRMHEKTVYLIVNEFMLHLIALTNLNQFELIFESLAIRWHNDPMISVLVLRWVSAFENKITDWQNHHLASYCRFEYCSNFVWGYTYVRNIFGNITNKC